MADTGLRTWAPAAQEFERWSRSMSAGDIMFSAGQLRAGRLAFKDVGHDKIITPIIGVLAAEAEVRKGRADQALALTKELITEIRASGLRWQEAELLRVSGEARQLGHSGRPRPRRSRFDRRRRRRPRTWRTYISVARSAVIGQVLPIDCAR